MLTLVDLNTYGLVDVVGTVVCQVPVEKDLVCDQVQPIWVGPAPTYKVVDAPHTLKERIQKYERKLLEQFEFSLLS